MLPLDHRSLLRSARMFHRRLHPPPAPSQIPARLLHRIAPLLIFAVFVVTVSIESARCGEHTTSARAPVHPIRTHADIEFARPGGVPLLMDIHLPEGVNNPPLVMFIHGGGWRQGDRKKNKLDWLPAHGYAVASIEYRLSQEGVFPAQIHDCKGARCAGCVPMRTNTATMPPASSSPAPRRADTSPPCSV